MASTYGETIRLKVRTTDNPTKAPMTLRQLATATGYSYEHIRKMLKGEPVISFEFNEALCAFLGLDAVIMWQLAQGEKARRRFGLALATLPKDQRLLDLWPKLTEVDRERVIAIAEGYALANDADRARRAITAA